MAQQYTRGGDVLRRISSVDGAVRSQLGDLRSRLQSVETESREDLARRGEKLMDLAEHYLPDFDRRNIEQLGADGRDFARVRQDLIDLVREKERRQVELQHEWDAALDRRLAARTEIDELTAELDELVDRRDELEQQLAERLKDDADFAGLSQQALAAEAELERNTARVSDAKREAEEKLPAYEKSRLFKYLLDHGYGTPGYKKRGLGRRLDRWVAKLVKWEKAKQSYDFLRVTPELMQAEVERRRREFNGLMQQIDAIEQRHSDAIGLTDILKQGLKAGKARDAAVTKLETEQAEQDRLSKEIDQLAGDENQFYREAVTRLQQHLGAMRERALEEQTRSTVEAKDDAIFSEIAWLNQRLEQARDEAEAIRGELAKLERTAATVSELARRFRAAEFDSRRSVFPAGYDPRGELEALVRGEMSREQVWRAIQGNQRFLPHWVEERWDRRGDILDSDFSYVLMRVLAEAAGAAIRHAADKHRRSSRSHRTTRRSPSVRRRTRGGFTRGRGF